VRVDLHRDLPLSFEAVVGGEGDVDFIADAAGEDDGPVASRTFKVPSR
jgi:hypothetical protein